MKETDYKNKRKERQIGDCDQYKHTTIFRKIANKNLLNSTENSIQYLVKIYTGEYSKRGGFMCVCGTDSYCCSAETNTTL